MGMISSTVLKFGCLVAMLGLLYVVDLLARRRGREPLAAGVSLRLTKFDIDGNTECACDQFGIANGIALIAVNPIV